MTPARIQTEDQLTFEKPKEAVYIPDSNVKSTDKRDIGYNSATAPNRMIAPTVNPLAGLRAPTRHPSPVMPEMSMQARQERLIKSTTMTPLVGTSNHKSQAFMEREKRYHQQDDEYKKVMQSLY